MLSIVASFNFLGSSLGIFDCNVPPGVGKFFLFERNDLPVGKELDIKLLKNVRSSTPQPMLAPCLPRPAIH